MPQKFRYYFEIIPIFRKDERYPAKTTLMGYTIDGMIGLVQNAASAYNPPFAVAGTSALPAAKIRRANRGGEDAYWG